MTIKLEEVKLESDDVLVLFDVTSLFPSIPLDKVLINFEKGLHNYLLENLKLLNMYN
jgi:hypothetical protein